MSHPSNLIAPQKNIQVPPQSVLKYRKQVMMMLAAVVLAFFICMLPFRALTLWIVLAPAESIFDVGLEARYILIYFSRIMFHINSAVNPILYNIMSSKFRGGFFRLCGMKNLRRRLRRKTEASRKSTTSSTTPSTQQTSEGYLRSIRQQSQRFDSCKLKEARDIIAEEDVIQTIKDTERPISRLARNVYVRVTPHIIIDGHKLPGGEIYV